MIKKQIVESQLHCKATAELADSIIDDMLKTDGSLKDLLDDTDSEHNNESNNSDRSSIEKSR